MIKMRYQMVASTAVPNINTYISKVYELIIWIQRFFKVDE